MKAKIFSCYLFNLFYFCFYPAAFSTVNIYRKPISLDSFKISSGSRIDSELQRDMLYVKLFLMKQKQFSDVIIVNPLKGEGTFFIQRFLVLALEFYAAELPY